MRDYIAWHEAYDDPSSSLARRLAVVQRRLDEALDSIDQAQPRLLSLCAGEGRDVIPVLASRRSSTEALLVELDPTLAARASDSAAASGLEGLDVRCADASDPSSWDDVLPVDVLLLCGIFGNVDPQSVHDVVAAVPSLLAAGGHVIWTRGGSEPDHRDEVRRWFVETGLVEVAFDGAPEPYGVGVNRLGAAPAERRPLPRRLFTFTR